MSTFVKYNRKVPSPLEWFLMGVHISLFSLQTQAYHTVRTKKKILEVAYTNKKNSQAAWKKTSTKLLIMETVSPYKVRDSQSLLDKSSDVFYCSCDQRYPVILSTLLPHVALGELSEVKRPGGSGCAVRSPKLRLCVIRAILCLMQQRANQSVCLQLPQILEEGQQAGSVRETFLKALRGSGMGPFHLSVPEL